MTTNLETACIWGCDRHQEEGGKRLAATVAHVIGRGQDIIQNYPDLEKVGTRRLLLRSSLIAEGCIYI